MPSGANPTSVLGNAGAIASKAAQVIRVYVKMHRPASDAIRLDGRDRDGHC